MSRIITSDEFYTPIDYIESVWYLENVNDSVIDPNAGQGAWLYSYLQYKLKNNVSHEDALKQLFGVEIQCDSVKICKTRLLMGREDLRHIVDRNIICSSALTYHYRFDGTPDDPLDTFDFLFGN